MMFKLNRILVFLFAVLWLWCATVTSPVCYGQEDTEPNSTAGSEQLFSDWFKEGAESTAKKEVPESSPMKQLMVAISVVIVLGICAYWITRKFMPRLTRISGKNISVIETVSLGTNKNLHLIEVGGSDKLLISSTNDNINLIANVTKTLSAQKSESVSLSKDN